MAGISNRESPEEEAAERREHPPVDGGSPPPEDAAGRVGENPLADQADRQTSHKAGSRSIAQKEADVRYPDRSMPATHKVAGAFGKESNKSSSEPDNDSPAAQSAYEGRSETPPADTDAARRGPAAGAGPSNTVGSTADEGERAREGGGAGRERD